MFLYFNLRKKEILFNSEKNDLLNQNKEIFEKSHQSMQAMSLEFGQIQNQYDEAIRDMDGLKGQLQEAQFEKENLIKLHHDTSQKKHLNADQDAKLEVLALKQNMESIKVDYKKRLDSESAILLKNQSLVSELKDLKCKLDILSNDQLSLQAKYDQVEFSFAAYKKDENFRTQQVHDSYKEIREQRDRFLGAKNSLEKEIFSLRLNNSLERT